MLALSSGVALVEAFWPGSAAGQNVMCESTAVTNVSVDCTGGTMTVAIAGGTFGPLEILPSYEESFGVNVFNAGVIDAGGPTALMLTGASVAYHGVSSARLASEAMGIEVISPGEILIDVDHDISAKKGILVTATSTSFQKVSVELKGGWLDSNGLGIGIDHRGAEGLIDIVIGANAGIRMTKTIEVDELAAVRVDGYVPVTVSLAGQILGQDQQSSLSNADDTLELLPGFALQGTIDGGEQRSARGDVLRIAGGSSLQVSDLLGRSADGAPAPFTGFETLVVGSQARLAGFGDLSIFDQVEITGTLAPGEFGAGSLVAGDAVFKPHSIFAIDIGDDQAQLDYLKLDSVTINGGIVRVVNTTVREGSFTIIRLPDDVSAIGTFTRVEHAEKASYKAELFYDSGEVRLVFSSRDPSDPLEPDPEDPDSSGPVPSKIFAQHARTPEQAAVTNILDNLGESAPYYAQFLAMDSAQKTAFLAQLAGSGFASTGAALLQSTATLSAASLGRIQQQSGSLAPPAVLGYSTFTTDERWTNGLHPSTWGRLIAGTSTIGGAASGSVTLIGGVDVELADDWTLGLLAGIGSSSAAQGNSSSRSSNFSAGFYGAKEFGMVALRYGGSLTHHSIASTRTVTAPGIVDRYTADYGALTAQLFAEVAVEFDLGAVSLELFGDVGYARNFAAGFTETGGAGALTVAGSSSDAVETLLGVRASHKTALGTRLLTTGVMVGWKHRFMKAPSTMNSLSGGTPFEVAATAINGSALAAGVDLRLDLNEQTEIDLSYTLEWGATGAAHGISARLTHRF